MTQFLVRHPVRVGRCIALALLLGGCGLGSSMDLPVLNAGDVPRTFYLIDLADRHALGTYTVPANSWGVIHGLPVPRREGLELSVFAVDCSLAGTTGIPGGTPANVVVIAGTGEPALTEISESASLGRVELATAGNAC